MTSVKLVIYCRKVNTTVESNKLRRYNVGIKEGRVDYMSDRRLVREIVIRVYSDGSTHTDTIEVPQGNKGEQVRVVTESEWKTGILALGSKGEVGRYLRLDDEVIIRMGEHSVRTRTHSMTKGRINGLTRFFKDNNINTGDTLRIRYNKETKTVYLKRV